MAGILAVGEVTDGRVASVTHELTAAGKTLDQTLGEGVSVVLMGEGIANLASEVTARGADKVYLVDDPLLKDSQIDASLAVLKRLCDEISPSVVLVGKSLAGRDIGPRLAFRLGVTVAQDCSDLNVDANTKRLVAHRPVYGGNAIAVVAFPSDDPQVAVLRAKAFEPLESDSSRQAEVVNFPAGIDDSVVKARVIETVKEEAEGVRLEDAEIVISGGRGLGGPEPFKDLEELAGLLGAAVGASRAVCDAGWLDHSYQVGLTGKTITPNLYITVAISGASQHMAGCSGAKVIVAINKDKDANIFKEARYGVTGDWQKVLPSFTATVAELVKG